MHKYVFHPLQSHSAKSGFQSAILNRWNRLKILQQLTPSTHHIICLTKSTVDNNVYEVSPFFISSIVLVIIMNAYGLVKKSSKSSSDENYRGNRSNGTSKVHPFIVQTLPVVNFICFILDNKDKFELRSHLID